MSVVVAASGLNGLTADVREFVAAVRFARPELLWLLLVLPVFALLNRYAAARRRKATAEIGRPAAVAMLSTHPARGRRWIGLAYPLAWLALVLGLAGPRWGKSDETGVAVGRDLVVVVDLSRSMLAADMAADGMPRWKAARAALLDLMDAVSKRGGHRVAVVVFAARPKLVCPLTTDYDHVRAKIEDLDGEFPPPEVKPGADPSVTSGTRIGAGVIAAVAAHDPRFQGFQDVILLSDGDDPAGGREWRFGAAAAFKAYIPVHAVGLGDPSAEVPIVIRGEFLEAPPDDNAPPDVVRSKLHEEPLKGLASDTRGRYVPAQREVPRLGEFFRTVVEPNPSRPVSDDAVPQRKERYAWFLGPALLLFLVGWVRGK
jgi:Ca-activated chloride channel family protein